MTGKFSQYFRTGSQRNTKLELIYQDLLGSLGSSYVDNTSISQEIFAYAKAINYFQNQAQEHLNNQYFPLKYTFNLQNEISKYNLGFLRSEYEQRLFLSLIKSSVSQAINLNSLTVILSALCPNTFSGIFLNSTSNQIWCPNYQSYNSGIQKPLDVALAANGGLSITGGPSWTYNETQNYMSTIDTYRIGVKNVPGFTDLTRGSSFKYDLLKMTTLLNIILPACINYNFCVLKSGATTGIILGGQEIIITGTSTINQTLHFSWVDANLGAQTIGIGLSSGNPAGAVAAAIQSDFSGTSGGFPGYNCSIVSSTSVFFSEPRCLYMTAAWSVSDPGQTVVCLNSGGLGLQVTGSAGSSNPGSPVNILDGFHAF